MISINVDNKIRIEKSGLPASIVKTIKDQVTFRNPLYELGVKQFSTGSTVTRYLNCWWENDKGFFITRGFLNDLLEMLDDNGLQYIIDDRTLKVPGIEFTFQGELTALQYQTAKAHLSFHYGILCDPSGSMVMALFIISRRRQPFLIIVKRKTRMVQWLDAITKCLGVDRDQIGIIGSGKKEVDKVATVAIDRSLYGKVNKLKSRIGLVVVDCCDLVNLKIFFKGVYPFPCRYLLGISTARIRRDGLTGLMEGYLGKLHRNETGENE